MQFKVISITHFWYSVIVSENSDQRRILKPRDFVSSRPSVSGLYEWVSGVGFSSSSPHSYSSLSFRDTSICTSLWDIMKFPGINSLLFVCFKNICRVAILLTERKCGCADVIMKVGAGMSRGAGKASGSRSKRWVNLQWEECVSPWGRAEWGSGFAVYVQEDGNGCDESFMARTPAAEIPMSPNQAIQTGR